MNFHCQQVLRGWGTQGSVLVPLLIILYENELHDLVQGFAKLFANDFKVYDKASRKDVLHKILGTLYKWSSNWSLKFNEARY